MLPDHRSHRPSKVRLLVAVTGATCTHSNRTLQKPLCCGEEVLQIFAAQGSKKRVLDLTAAALSRAQQVQLFSALTVAPLAPLDSLLGLWL